MCIQPCKRHRHKCEHNECQHSCGHPCMPPCASPCSGECKTVPCESGCCQLLSKWCAAYGSSVTTCRPTVCIEYRFVASRGGCCALGLEVLDPPGGCLPLWQPPPQINWDPPVVAYRCWSADLPDCAVLSSASDPVSAGECSTRIAGPRHNGTLLCALDRAAPSIFRWHLENVNRHDCITVNPLLEVALMAVVRVIAGARRHVTVATWGDIQTAIWTLLFTDVNITTVSTVVLVSCPCALFSATRVREIMLEALTFVNRCGCNVSALCECDCVTAALLFSNCSGTPITIVEAMPCDMHCDPRC